jgi:intracellular sulfur oxidation DsrE/DsrF family protein
MTPHLGLATLLLASLTALPVLSAPARAQSAASSHRETRAHSAPLAASSPQDETAASKQHRVVIQVSENDPKIMNLALNNAENLTRFYEQGGETVQIEIVAYGPGLNMVRSDTSPVRDRLAVLAGQHVTFSGCGNTLSTQSKQEGKEISLLPEAQLVPTGVARIVQLQEQGWTYVRP